MEKDEYRIVETVKIEDGRPHIMYVVEKKRVYHITNTRRLVVRGFFRSYHPTEVVEEWSTNFHPYNFYNFFETFDEAKEALELIERPDKVVWPLD